MADMLAADQATQKLFKWSGETTTLLASFSTSSVDTIPRGIDWDGTDVIYSGSQAGKGYRGTGFGLTVQDSYSTGATSNTRDITWSGTDAMDHQRTLDKWRERTGMTATVQSSFIKAAQPLGGTWHSASSDLLTTDNVNDKHRQHSGFTSTISSSFGTGVANAIGCTENTSDEFIDCQSGGVNKLRKRDVFTSTITASWSPTEGTNRVSVSWDGRYAAVAAGRIMSSLTGAGGLAGAGGIAGQGGGLAG